MTTSPTTLDLESLLDTQPLVDFAVANRLEREEAAATETITRRLRFRRSLAIGTATVATIALAIGAVAMLPTGGTPAPAAAPVATTAEAPEPAPVMLAKAKGEAPAPIASAEPEVVSEPEPEVVEAVEAESEWTEESYDDYYTEDYYPESYDEPDYYEDTYSEPESYSTPAPAPASPSMRDHAQSVVSSYVSGATVVVGSPCAAGRVDATADYSGVITICDGPNWDSGVGYSVLVHEAAHILIWQSHRAGTAQSKGECFVDLIAHRLGAGEYAGGYCGTSNWSSDDHALADEIL